MKGDEIFKLTLNSKPIYVNDSQGFVDVNKKYMLILDLHSITSPKDGVIPPTRELNNKVLIGKAAESLLIEKK